jgi:hypothetical protein
VTSPRLSTRGSSVNVGRIQSLAGSHGAIGRTPTVRGVPRSGIRHSGRVPGRPSYMHFGTLSRYGHSGGYLGSRGHVGVHFNTGCRSPRYHYGTLRYGYGRGHHFGHRPRYSFCFSFGTSYYPLYATPAYVYEPYGFYGFSSGYTQVVQQPPLIVENNYYGYGAAGDLGAGVAAVGEAPAPLAGGQVVGMQQAEPAPLPAPQTMPGQAGEGEWVPQGAAEPGEAPGEAPLEVQPGVPSETPAPGAPVSEGPGAPPSEAPSGVAGQAPAPGAPAGEEGAKPTEMDALAEEFVAHMRAGSDAFKRGEYRTARSYFHEAFRVLPTNADAPLALAIAHFAMGEYDVSALLLRQIVPLQPEIVHAAFDLREQYGDPAAFEKQVAKLRHHLTADPTDGDAWIVLGFVLHFSDQREEARQAFEAALKQNANDAVAKIFLNPPPLPERPAGAEVPPTTQPAMSAPTTPPPASVPTTQPAEPSSSPANKPDGTSL